MHRIKSVPKVKSGNVRRLEKKGHAEESRPRKSQTHAVISFADFRIRSFVRKRFFSTFSHDLKAGRLLVLTPDVFLRLAFLGDPEDRPRQRTPLAVRLVGGRVVRVEAPSFLLQVPQNQLPQGLNCGERETVKTQSGDSCPFQAVPSSHRPATRPQTRWLVWSPTALQARWKVVGRRGWNGPPWNPTDLLWSCLAPQKTPELLEMIFGKTVNICFFLFYLHRRDCQLTLGTRWGN